MDPASKATDADGAGAAVVEEEEQDGHEGLGDSAVATNEKGDRLRQDSMMNCDA